VIVSLVFAEKSNVGNILFRTLSLTITHLFDEIYDLYGYHIKW